MDYNELDRLKAERDHRRNRYFFSLKNYGESYNDLNEQHAEEAHERIERVYQRYVDARDAYETALAEYMSSHPMTEYTSF